MRLTASLINLTALLPLTLSSTTPKPSSSKDGLTIQTTSGTLHGFINTTTPHVHQFLGIPYAEPPIGPLRFLPPVTKAKVPGIIDATKFGASCMQQFSNGKTIYTEQVPQFLINGGNAEDCLFLNVWAPVERKGKAKRNGGERKKRGWPVLLYIPGGGFTGGGANSDYKLPHNWVERTQGHIVVVMNYRVNVFGYPNAAALVDQNPGLLDQRKAVEWTYANIAAFGGDPSRITLWGQSAGGASASLYSYAYPKNPLISSLIADSGSANIVQSLDTTHSNFTFLASLVNCGNLLPKPELECMQKVDAQVLENALSNYGISGAKPAARFVPFTDGRTVFVNNTERALRGEVAKIPAIMGTNANEGAGFVPWSPSGPGEAALFSATQSIIACPLAVEVRNRNLASLPTYRYQYVGNFTNISPVSWMGAYHSSELPLIFGTHFEFRGQSTNFEYQVSYTMEDLWLAFVSNPTQKPGISSNGHFKWPLYDQSSKKMVLFADGKTAVQVVSGDRIDGKCPA